MSVLENWKREFEKWLPEATVVVYNGSKQSRQLCESLEFFFDLCVDGKQLHVPKFNVLLSSYDSLRTDFLQLAQFDW